MSWWEHALIAASPIIAVITLVGTVLGWGWDAKLSKFEKTLHDIFMGKDEAAAKFEGLGKRLDDLKDVVVEKRRIGR